VIRILFVCLGNICRSPTAEGIFRARLEAAGLQDRIEIDSAGTGDWHLGRGPDPRAQESAAAAGYDISALRARQVSVDDFFEFDYILAMDGQNLHDLQAMQPEHSAAVLELMLSYGSSNENDVPDPYYGGDDGFKQVIALLEDSADGLLADLT